MNRENSKDHEMTLFAALEDTKTKTALDTYKMDKKRVKTPKSRRNVLDATTIPKPYISMDR